MKTISTPLGRYLENVVDDALTSIGEFDSFNTTTFVLVDNLPPAANFPTTGGVGDIVFNPEDSRQWATIVSVDSATQITLDRSIDFFGVEQYSVAPAATAFLVITDDKVTADKWMTTYSVGDKVIGIGPNEATNFNLGLATILSLDYDGTVGSETATMTLDLPIDTAVTNDIKAYVKGELQTIPVNELQYVKFALAEDETYAEFSFNGDVSAYLYPALYERDLPSLIQLEKNVLDAIQEVLRSPWPTANAMIKDSYGMVFDF
ncbi:hypothetical protein N9242_04085 [Vicingaceae bacterium]|nr:hypothetical protein [Vicingaceae bacterium]